MGRYDDETRQSALDCLAANEGDCQATSAATGISAGTLRRWAKQEQERVSGGGLTQLHEELAALKTQIKRQSTRAESASDDLQGWVQDRLLPHLIDDAMALSASIKDVIDDAP